MLRKIYKRWNNSEIICDNNCEREMKLKFHVEWTYVLHIRVINGSETYKLLAWILSADRRTTIVKANEVSNWLCLS